MVSFDNAKEIFNRSFFDLIEEAHSVHVKNFKKDEIQVSSLLSIQTGGCCEDCAYCAQSIRNHTKMPKQMITDIDTVIAAAKKAKSMGSSRFCMGASGRKPSEDIFNLSCELVKKIKKLGMEACLTLGTLNEEQVKKLKDCGLDYYNHNVDTSPEYYSNVITTRTIDERINTINLVQKYGINVCTGGILGMGESNDDRVKMIVLLANLEQQPKSISLNKLVKIPGTRLKDIPDIDQFDFIRVVALARILMPKSYIRMSAGRESMPESWQALCMFAGANSFFIGEKLLTTENSNYEMDLRLLEKLNLKPKQCNE